MPRARQRLPAAQAFGARVRARRTELGWSQRVLAETAGLDWSYVAQVERGERNIALLNTLRLALALGMDPAELVRGLRP
jgi:transcriptional regulator with XRE-family HTH domain